LKSAVVKGPGFALSAPDFAERFSLRPAQVQRSLDKLYTNSMINTVIGSTDGFDNYRLTDSGTAFVAMWERQQPDLGTPHATSA
jgi:DNA-binding MarR family transcriptional regulator